MNIHHHLQDATLMAYAAGSLPEAFNLIVATHVSMCDTCRATVESYDALGGTVIGQSNAVAMSASSLEQTMARLKMLHAAENVMTSMREGDPNLPKPLYDYVGGGLEAIAWRPIGLGAKQAILSTSKDATARLLFIPAGVAMPDHSHNGVEMTLVLQGAFHDDGETFSRGDIELADGDVTHTPIADMSQDCICLAVTDAPLQFKGWLPRLVGRFARI